MTEAKPAMGLGDRGSHPAQFRHAAPQIAIERGIAIQYGARRRMIAEKPGGLIAQQFLFIGEIEVHVTSVSCPRASRNSGIVEF